MHKLTIRPSGQVLEVDEKTNLLDALKTAGLYVKSSCGGHASCSDCIVKVLEGEDFLNTPSFEEVQLMGNVFHITKERLTCQTFASGPVTIDVSQHDKSKVEERLRNKSHTMKSKAPVSTRVRKKDEVEKMYEERAQIRESLNEKRDSWKNHWQREEDGVKKVKRLGGGKRPKPFRTDHLDEDAPKKERRERPERESFASRDASAPKKDGKKKDFRSNRNKK